MLLYTWWKTYICIKWRYIKSLLLVTCEGFTWNREPHLQHPIRFPPLKKQIRKDCHQSIFQNSWRMVVTIVGPLFRENLCHRRLTASFVHCQKIVNLVLVRKCFNSWSPPLDAPVRPGIYSMHLTTRTWSSVLLLFISARVQPQVAANEVGSDVHHVVLHRLEVRDGALPNLTLPLVQLPGKRYNNYIKPRPGSVPNLVHNS